MKIKLSELNYDEPTDEEIMALQESSIKKIWGNDYEDDAWKHLNITKKDILNFSLKNPFIYKR